MKKHSRRIIHIFLYSQHINRILRFNTIVVFKEDHKTPLSLIFTLFTLCLHFKGKYRVKSQLLLDCLPNKLVRLCETCMLEKRAEERRERKRKEACVSSAASWIPLQSQGQFCEKSSLTHLHRFEYVRYPNDRQRKTFPYTRYIPDVYIFVCFVQASRSIMHS